jgi:UPF0148 protein
LPNKADEELHIKRMADLLRQGATLTELACPVCASPLLRFKNQEPWCAKCQKRVVVVREGEENKIAGTIMLDTLETTLLTKIQDIQDRMQHEQNPEELQKLGTTLTGLLDSLEKARKAKKA